MGRLIDADVLREEINSWGMNDYEPSDFTDAIDDAPTIEAIPKAQYDELKANITMMQLDYEARLKADMVAMLEEIQLEIEELDPFGDEWSDSLDACNDIIQQKINSLKENTDGTNID